MALREFFAAFDIDGSGAEATMRRLDKGVKGLEGKLGSLAEAFLGSALVHGFTEFIKGQIDAGSAVNDMAEKLGVGTDELQAFQFAAKLSGVEAQSAGQALGFLNKNIGEAIGGNADAAQTFAKLGVALKDGTGHVRELGDILPDLADAFQGMESSPERTATAMKIFGKSGAALIPLLKDGSGELKRMAQEFKDLGGGMSGEFVKNADKAGDEIDKLKFGLNSWKSQIAGAALPTITNFVIRLQGWVKSLIAITRETNLAKYAVVIMGAASAAAFIKASVAASQFLGLLPKGGGFWKTVLGMGELAIWIGLLIAAALIFEDLWTGIEGGDSLIKDLITDALGIQDANAFFAQLKIIVDQIEESFSSAGETLKPFLKDLDKVGGIGGIVATVFMHVVKSLAMGIRLLGAFAEGVAAIMSAVTKAEMGDVSGLAGLGDNLSGIVSKTSDSLGGLFKEPQKNHDLMMDRTPLSARAEGAGANAPVQVTQQNKVDVTVQGGMTNADTGRNVANGVRDGLDGHLENAVVALDTGG